MALTEVISDPTRRVFWLANYGIDTKLTPLDGTSTSIYIKPGSVSVNGGPAVTWAGGYLVPQNPMYVGRGAATGTLVLPFVANATHNLYVDPTTGNIAMSQSTPPAGALNLYTITTDGVIRFNSVKDVRPWTGFATMETVSDTTLRASYGNSFSFSEVTQQNGSAYMVQVGNGTVTVGATTRVTGGGWVDLTPLSASTAAPSATTAYTPGSTVQAFIDANGIFQTRLIEYPIGTLLFGVSSITQFPGGSLPLFIAHLDGIGRIATLDDYRPA